MDKAMSSDGSAADGRLETAFYTVADRRYFIGAVALLNSLRLVGHSEPLVIVDAGLTAEQKSVIGEEAILVPAPPGVPIVSLKPHGPKARPADVAVIIDSDMIVVRALSQLIEEARRGAFVAFLNNHDRFVPEWSSLLGLPPLQRNPYFNAGLLFIPHSIGSRFIEQWIEAQERAALGQFRFEKAGTVATDPLAFGDQDVCNAIASTYLEPGQIRLVENRLAPMVPFSGIRLIDKRGLVCSFRDGARPYLLHHISRKPWLQPTTTNVYTRLLPRVLLGPDVAVRLEPDTVPLRLREGWLALVDRGRASMQASIRTSARRQLGRFGIRTRLAARRSARATRG
jgi:hypothetical protein